jgi:hypothetical protein
MFHMWSVSAALVPTSLNEIDALIPIYHTDVNLWPITDDFSILDVTIRRPINLVPVYRRIVATLYPCSSDPRSRSVFIMNMYGEDNNC